MNPIETYRYVGVSAVVILAIGLGLLAIRWPRGIHKTFSQHAAASRCLIVYYAVLFSIVLVLLNIFFITWFIPTFRLSGIFTVLILGSSLCQLLCTFIPETNSWRIVVHRILAAASAVLLLPCLPLLFTLNGGEIAIASFIVMTCIIAIVFITRAKPRYSLLLQTTYFIAFFAPIIALSYAG